MHKYRLVAKKGEGTFSEVLKAQCIKNGKYVAIKCMKNHFDSLDQVNNLREIQALRRLSPHANIIKLQEVLYDQPTGRLALVFELMDMNIYELIRGRRHYVAEERVRNYMYQLMKAMDHMHRNGIFHRDIKPENILIMDDCLKLADFGSCRGIYSKQPYTEYISTRWYRAPECLLTDGYYNYKMDMWGVGCVFFEIVSLFPLFPGTNELDQIQKIHNILGTPPPELLAKMKKRSQHMDFNFPVKEGSGIAKLIPHVSPDCSDLIIKLLAYNPDERLSARQALRHPYFRELREVEKRQKALMTPEVSNLSSSNGLTGMGAPGQSISGGTLPSTHAAEADSKPVRHQSPVLSEGDLGLSTSPPQTSQANEGSNPGLPSIAKASHSHSNIHGQGAGNAHQQGPGQHYQQGSHTHHGGGAGADGTAGRMSVTNPPGMMGDPADDAGAEAAAFRIPGLHAESSMDNMSTGPDGGGGLPPIGNHSLGKGSLAGSQTQRRGMPNIYDTTSSGSNYNKNKAAAAAAAAAMAKRQGMPLQAKFSNKGVAGPQVVGQGPVSGHKVVPMPLVPDLTGTGSSVGYKYKANAAKGSTKYVSPYSLRQLAGAVKE